MLETKLIELILRGLPEAFILMFAAHLFFNKPLEKQPYIISSFLFGALGFLIRFLPIHYGVHIILNLFIYILLLVNILNFDLNKAVSASIITFMLQITSEALNVIIIEYIFMVDINLIFSNPICKTLYGIPSLLITYIFLFLYYLFMKRRRVY